jgi:hypothetical protein
MRTEKKAEASKTEAFPQKPLADVSDAVTKATKGDDVELAETELKQVTGGSNAAHIVRPTKQPICS